MNIILFISIIIFFIYLHHHFSRDYWYDPTLVEIRNSLIPVNEHFADIPIYGSTSTYTDKETIYVCHKWHGITYDKQMIIQCLLHEMAHVLSKQYDPDHKTKEFNDHHRELRRRAIELGLLDPNIPVVCDYCGINTSKVSCRKPKVLSVKA